MAVKSEDPAKSCSICDRKVQARGLCSTHYSQGLRSGAFAESRYTTKMSIADRLAHFSKDDVRLGCRIWTGSTNRAGYGRLGVDGRVYLAHRLAYEQAQGQIPKGMHVCHRCDTPGCVNPLHLFLGTDVDNSDDKVAKGRQMRGVAYTPTKLNDDVIVEIRNDLRTQDEIAEDYGISQSLVSLIKLKQRWAHVP